MVSKNTSVLLTDQTVAPERSPLGRHANWRPRLPRGSEVVDIISSLRGAGRARQQLSLLSLLQRAPNDFHNYPDGLELHPAKVTDVGTE